MVPLRFLGHDPASAGSGGLFGDGPDQHAGPPVVLVTPEASVSRSALLAFGASLADAAQADGRRVAFIASSDWSHAHGTERQESATAVDAAVVSALRDGEPERLLDLDARLAEAAGIDGLGPILMLAGVMRRNRFLGSVLSYEAPPAYATGLIVAAYVPSASQ